MKNLKFYLLIFTLSSSVILLSFILLPKEETGGEQLFEEFISQFDKAELPYEITIPESEKLEDGVIQAETAVSDKLISHQFSAFVSGLARSMYSRMPPSRYYFKDVIYENKDFILVTYGVQSYRSRVPDSVDEYVLASYSKNAKTKDVDRLLSLRTVAKNDYYEVKQSIIGEDLMIKTVTSNNTKNEEGELVKSDKTATDRYKITEDGKIKVVITKKVPQKKGIIIRAD
jgi:hypothetical protein